MVCEVFFVVDLSSYNGRHFAEDGMVEDMKKKRGAVLISTEQIHDVFSKCMSI